MVFQKKQPEATEQVEQPKKEKFVVLDKLPQQPVNQFTEDDGTKVTIYETNEALTEILTIVRKLEKLL